MNTALAFLSRTKSLAHDTTTRKLSCVWLWRLLVDDKGNVP